MLEAKTEKFWDLVDRKAEIKKVAGGFAFTEGPVFSRRGYMYFSDIPNERIMKFERGEVTTYREKSNKANGNTFDHQGRLITAEGNGRVTRTEKNGSITVLADQGLKGPNDLVYAIDGSVYFTDLPESKVYQITRERSGVGGAPPKGEVRVVITDAVAPNGVTLSSNQLKLYVADVKKNLVRVHDVQGDGKVANGKDFAPLRVDGLKTDEAGNVWMASRDGIYVYDAGGQHLGTIKTPEGPSNCCWGEGFRGMYITARTSVYHIPTKVPGTRTY